jgi:enoyl-[acyl-carrier protein] reductase II
MKRTRVCDLLGIEYPIVQGALGYMSGGEMAAAVSNAGGLGTVALTARTEDRTPMPQWPKSFREEIQRAKSLTDKPFAANVAMDNRIHDKYVEAVLDEGVKVVVTAAGSPRLYTRVLKEAGIKVMHLVFSVRHAQVAEAEGVDAVIASGCDGGGFVHLLELTTMVLVPQVVDAVKIPVLAAGGIADARGLVAAFALGAEGVQLGTRFMATRESLGHDRLKEAVLKATETDTIVTGRKSEMAMRCLRNQFTTEFMEREAEGLSKEDLGEFVGTGRNYRAAMLGEIEVGSIGLSPTAGMIKKTIGAGEVVRELVEGYDRIVAGLK